MTKKAPRVLLYLALAALILWAAPIPLRRGWVDGAEGCFMTVKAFGVLISRGECVAIWVDGVRYKNVGGGIYEAENGDRISRRRN